MWTQIISYLNTLQLHRLDIFLLSSPLLPGLLWYCGPELLNQYSDLQRAWRFRDRIPVGEKSFGPIQTGPLAPTASYTKGTRSILYWPGGACNHPPLSNAKVKEGIQQHTYYPSETSLPVIGWNLSLLLRSKIFLHQLKMSFTCYTIQRMHYSHLKTHSLQHLRPIKC
jgi:hypothetical protein